MAVKRYPSRWLIMGACLLFMSIGGCVYSFGLISDAIKTRLNLSQSQLDIISVIGQVGASSTIIPGTFNNYFGPKLSIWVGLVVVVVGWSSVLILTTQIIDISSLSYSYIIISSAAFVYGNGLTWFSGICAPVIAQNFPKCDHGKYLGLAKGYLGIGSAYIATYKSYLADDNVDAFMYAVLAFLILFGLTHSWFILKLPKYFIYQYTDDENPKSAKIWYLAGSCLMLYLLITTILFQDVFSPPRYLEIALFVITQILWYLPMFLALFNHGKIWVYLDPEMDDKMDDLLINPDTGNSEQNKLDRKVADVGMPHIFKTVDFWLLYLPFIFLAGSGLIFIANVAQIVESALSSKNDDKTSDSITTSIVTVISCGNFLGRIIVGYVSDLYRNRFHRVFFMMPSSVGMIISTVYLFVISSIFEGNEIIFPLTIGAFCVGMSYGWMFSCVLASVCDLWGTRYLSGNYAVFDSCGALGQLILSNGVFAAIYEYQGKTKEHDGHKCYGNNCFKYAFLIASACCIISFIMSFILWRLKEKQRKKELEQE